MTAKPLLTPLKRQTLSVDVYEQFKELLVSGRLMPGEQISLRSMAEGLGVSVMPVREAVQRLCAEQALEIAPNRTLRVPLMTTSQFREITSIRMNLEGLATATATEKIKPDEMRQVMLWLETFIAEMKNDVPDGAKLISFNKELHFTIYRAAQMPVLMQLIEALWLRIGPILNYDIRSGSDRIGNKTALIHHNNMVEAIRTGNAEAAKEALKRDISSAAEFIISAGVLVSADHAKL
jgi:DNA-binding GntR family transcriptional regulator